MKKVLLFALLFVLVVSCNVLPSGSKVGSKQVAISSTQWQLADQVKGKTPTLILEQDRISGNAGCNHYFGTLSLNASNGGFSVTRIGSTKMACEDMMTETNFLQALSQVDTYVVNQGVLELYKGNLLLMKFNRFTP